MSSRCVCGGGGLPRAHQPRAPQAGHDPPPPPQDAWDPTCPRPPHSPPPTPPPPTEMTEMTAPSPVGGTPGNRVPHGLSTPADAPACPRPRLRRGHQAWSARALRIKNHGHARPSDAGLLKGTERGKLFPQKQESAAGDADVEPGHQEAPEAATGRRRGRDGGSGQQRGGRALAGRGVLLAHGRPRLSRSSGSWTGRAACRSWGRRPAGTRRSRPRPCSCWTRR